MKKRKITKKVELTFLNLDKKLNRGGENLKITKSGVYLSGSIVKTLQVKKGDFILLAANKDNYYIGKKPRGVFGGHRLNESGGKTSNRLFIAIDSAKFKLTFGEYLLEDFVVRTLTTEQGKPVNAYMFSLIPT